MLDYLALIGRADPLFVSDLAAHAKAMDDQISSSRFLVVGGAGTIGAAVVRELFNRRPRVLHVVDVSENNLAELVRDVRSSAGYIDGEFKTYCLDCLGTEFDAFVQATGEYDAVMNFSALKHVRSEKDPFTLMRMINVNVFGTLKTIEAAHAYGARRYFCVSTDKVSNPVNLMGASKRIMEMFLMRESDRMHISSARFANVLFSDGSLPFSWTQRLRKRQPIVAPRDVRRYFVTAQEGALLCLLSTLLGDNRDIFFPRLDEDAHLTTFDQIAHRYLESLGFEPYVCETEDEARARVDELAAQRRWPCYFFDSDTTGEKAIEEFHTDSEAVDWNRFADIGVVKNDVSWNADELRDFEDQIRDWQRQRRWSKREIVELFRRMLPHLEYEDVGKYLDDKM